MITFYLSEAEDLLREALHWWNWLAVLVLVAFYASNIYGRILPKYGGGAPTPVVLYLNRPLPWDASGAATTLLLDETDQGYFVTMPGGDGALFIPRSDVSAAYFGPSSHAPKMK